MWEYRGVTGRESWGGVTFGQGQRTAAASRQQQQSREHKALQYSRYLVGIVQSSIGYACPSDYTMLYDYCIDYKTASAGGDTRGERREWRYSTSKSELFCQLWR